MVGGGGGELAFVGGRLTKSVENWTEIRVLNFGDLFFWSNPPPSPEPKNLAAVGLDLGGGGGGAHVCS